MDDSRVTVVGSVYQAFGGGDVEAIGGLLAEVEWHEAEGLPYGGVYRGAEAVFQNVFGPIARDVQGFAARPQELLPVGEDRVLALGRYTGTGSQGELDIAYAHVWTVQAGRVVKFVQYTDTYKYRQAVGSP